MSFILVGFGLICAFAGIQSLRRSHEILTSGQKTDAVVVAIERASFTERSQAKGWRAIYSYKDQHGREHRYPGGRISTSKTSFKLGERLPVVFDPGSPNEVVEAGSLKIYAGSALYLLFASAMIAVGVAAYIYDWAL